MKNILYILNYRSQVGGISGQVEFLISHLDKKLYSTDIFSTRGGIIKRIFLVFRLLFDASKYDILHAHGCSGLGGFFPVALATGIGNLLGKKVVVTYHGGEAAKFFQKYPRFVPWVLRQANQIIVLSSFLEAIFQDYHLRVHIIPNAIEFYPNIRSEDARIDPVFISTRTLSPLYDIQCVINAFALLKKNHPEAILYIVGDGPLATQLHNFVSDHNITNVIFTGRVKNNIIYDYLAKASIWVSAPRIDNMPVSLLEAINAGLLIISSNVGGIPFLIEHKKNGLLFPYNDHAELAVQMQYALNNREQVKSMVLEAKKSLPRYHWENIEQNLYTVYKF